MHNKRVKRLLDRFNQLGVDAYLVTKPENVYYYSNFYGNDSALLISKENLDFFTDFRFIEQAENECYNFKINRVERGFLKGISQKIKSYNYKSIAFESSHLTFDKLQALKKINNKIKLISDPSGLEILRMIKDENEIKLMEDSIKSATLILNEVKKIIKIGMSELDIASELVYRYRKFGGECESFLPIVASGENSSIPHHKPTNRKLKRGDFLKIDFGIKKRGYCSDMTRTFFAGEIDKKKLEIYNIVKEAQESAILLIKPGVKIADIDHAARKIIEDNGYGKYFGHSLGHGVGLEIHERPGISSINQLFLKKGMIFTIEPGIYIPAFGGVRIEDVLLVTSTGYKNLTNYSNNPEIIAEN